MYIPKRGTGVCCYVQGELGKGNGWRLGKREKSSFQRSLLTLPEVPCLAANAVRHGDSQPGLHGKVALGPDGVKE